MEFYEGGYVDGDWANDQLNGFAKKVYANGDIYEGIWKDNKRNGKGFFIINNDGGR
jgi:1-phosphatidylinositol-4-phosphate 5-kinase